jgi:N-acetylglucosamine-6-sulfatase
MVSPVSSSLRLLVALAATVATMALAAPATAQTFAERPNILMIMTDDQTVESMRAMPYVQQLIADRGTTFDNSFVNFSLCCPSRATAFTGQYSQNNNVQGLAPPLGGYPLLNTSNYLPLWLQQAGYRTIHLGKFLNGYGSQNPDQTEVPPGWDVWQGSIDPTTYDYSRFTLNQDGTLVSYEDPGMYQTDFYTRRATRLIRDHAGSSRPFFFSLAYLAPHHGNPLDFDDPPLVKTPSVAGRHQNVFSNQLLPQPASFNELDVADKPYFIRRRPAIPPDRIADIQEAYQQRLESLLAVDEGVAQIVSALEETRELQNTLIIFTSDNGFLHGEHRIGFGKVVLYEPSIRVPLVMAGPGVPVGQRRRQLVTNADLSPTILDAAGGIPGLPQDGRSLFPLMRDSAMEWGRDLLIQGRATGHSFNGLRTPRYKYARYGNGGVEMYDLARDPDELHNLNRSRRHKKLRIRLSRRLQRLKRCRGRTCYAAPRVKMKLSPANGCVARSLRVTMSGKDSTHVRRVAFYAGRRRVRSVKPSRPLRARSGRTVRGLQRVIRTRNVRAGRRFRLRAKLTFNDGRLYTIDRKRRSCSARAR